MADIRITGRMVNFSRIRFDSNDLTQIRQQLTTLLAGQDHQGTLVVIDSSVTQELIELLQLLMEFGLQPMAVIDGVLGDDARAMQFPVIPPDQPTQRIKATSNSNEVASTAPEPTTAPVAHGHTIYHDNVLRTGQSLIEEHGDIVLTSSSNSGSEIIAAGNVYIYGTARGRIIAGTNGNPQTRIFCQQLEADLISIAGTYCLFDDIPAEYRKKPVQITLNSQQELEFSLLSI